MDESLGFSVDATPDAAVKKQLSQKDGKAQRRREQGQAEREAKLARLIFRDESLVDKLDELEPKSKRRSRAQAARDDGDEDGDEDGEDESEEEEGSEEEGEEESEDEAPKAAWVDEDDATLKVDVMQQKKLRKLRKTKKEAVLHGADYEERLREQVRRCHLCTCAAAPCTSAAPCTAAPLHCTAAPRRCCRCGRRCRRRYRCRLCRRRYRCRLCRLCRLCRPCRAVCACDGAHLTRLASLVRSGARRSATRGGRRPRSRTW